MDESLVSLMQEMEQFFGTELGTQAFERLALILTRPGMRIARARLEDLLPRSAVDPDDITEIVNAALFQFYQSIGRHKGGRSPLTWFTSMVRDRARELVRRKYHSLAKELPGFIPLKERAILAIAPGGGLEPRTAVEHVVEGRPPAARELLALVAEGRTEVEIAIRIHKPVWCVRKEIKKLRQELGIP
jgi:DNA-directed RNA polymerase specialized sigma24 family protein